MTDVDVDVVVVGLGPTGAVLAGLLGQRGVRVAAFDQLADLFPLPRAIAIDHEAMRILQELQVADRVAPYVGAYPPTEFRGVDGRLIRRLDMAPPPHRLGWAPNYVFEQPAVEGVVRDRLAELDNVRCEVRAEVVAVGQDDDRVWVDVRSSATSQAQRWRARYLVGCDGGASVVRKQLGVELEDMGFDEPWLVVDAIVDDDVCPRLPQTLVQYCETDRPSTFVPGVGNHRRWEVMLLPGDDLSAEFPEEELWPLLKRWLNPGEGRIWRAAAYRFHGLVAREWRRDRVLLAGDAAHMTPPFLAQGMVQGLRDAQNLAWKLARVLDGSSSADLLDSYEQERRPHVVTTTDLAIAWGRVVCERDPERAAERDVRLLAEQGGTVSTVYRQSMIPGLKAGLIDQSTPDAGVTQPQPLVNTTGGDGRLDELTGPRVRLIAVVSLSCDERTRLRAALAPLDGVLVELTTEAPPDVTTPGIVAGVEDEPVIQPWLEGVGQRFAAVRPDHYVYGTAATADEAVQLLLRLRHDLR